MNRIKTQESDRQRQRQRQRQQHLADAASARNFVVQAKRMRDEALAELPGELARLVRRVVSRITRSLRSGPAANEVRPAPTADAAGAEYLATAMAKWPAAIRKREPGRDSRTAATAVSAGIEHRAAVSQYRWLGLLAWRNAT